MGNKRVKTCLGKSYQTLALAGETDFVHPVAARRMEIMPKFRTSRRRF
jgi:hypothetical protein